MFTLPNLLSLLRFPLALVFLKHDIIYRSIALVVAMISDGLDGFLARRYKLSSRFGTILDPVMDRFFVFFLIGIFIKEGSLEYWEALSMACRDISVMVFGLYLVFSGRLSKYRFRAIWCGKVTTACQFVVFLAIILGYTIPPVTYSLFVVIGALALIELYINRTEHQIYLNNDQAKNDF